MSTTEDNKRLAAGLFEHAARGDYDAFERLLAPDYVVHEGSEDVHGSAGLREMVEEYRRVLAGMTITIEDQLAEGDKVATRFTVRGVHESEFMGAAPTGREVSLSGLTLSICKDGRIVEEWEETDTVGLLAQIGALPETASA